MLRGEIRLVNLDSVRRGEADKTRPGMIVSSDALNATTMSLQRGVVTVLPITSNVKKIFSFQVRIERGTTGLTMDSKTQVEQISLVAVSRVGERVG